MRITGYVYKFGNNVGTSEYVFDTESLCDLFNSMRCDHTKTMCFLEYPDNVMTKIPCVADAIGVCDFEIKEDGILCHVETLDTQYGRLIKALTDADIKNRLTFGYVAVFSRADSVSKEDKNLIQSNFRIPYIVLSTSTITHNYKVDKIER